MILERNDGSSVPMLFTIILLGAYWRFFLLELSSDKHSRALSSGFGHVIGPSILQMHDNAIWSLLLIVAWDWAP